MSRGARWTLGCFAMVFAACFLEATWSAPSKSPILDVLLPMFCTLIAMACFVQGWRGPAVRIIGAIVFVATVCYLVFELVNAPRKPYTGSSEPHWFNAIRALAGFGLPGLYVAVRGVFPAWGTGAVAFRGSSAQPAGDINARADDWPAGAAGSSDDTDWH